MNYEDKKYKFLYSAIESFSLSNKRYLSLLIEMSSDAERERIKSSVLVSQKAQCLWEILIFSIYVPSKLRKTVWHSVYPNFLKCLC